MEGATAKSEFSSSQSAPHSSAGSFFSTAILAVFFEGSPCRVVVRESTFTRQSAAQAGLGAKTEDITTENESHLDLSKSSPSQVKTQPFNPHADAQAAAGRQGLTTTQQSGDVFEVVVPTTQPNAFRFVKRVNGSLQTETRSTTASFKSFSTVEAAGRVADAIAHLADLCTATKESF
jgi:hypothetical protein